MTENAIQPLLSLLADGKALPYEQSARAFQIIMNGGATPAQIAAMLVAMRMRGETVEEIAGAATALRAKAQRFAAPANVMDVCGTGGDARGTYNISTATAFVVAACGVPVAKHGNRAVSSASGSADVLSALSVKIDAELPALQRCLEQAGICFLMAPRFHSAMRHVAPIRQELGMRTVFNLLGPLINPAQPKFQLLGVYDAQLIEKMAHVLGMLEVSRAWVVHGDGLDECTVAGVTEVAELRDGAVHRFAFTPEDAGLQRHAVSDLRGGNAEQNAQALRMMLLGERGAYRDAVLLNAAAALIIAGKAETLPDAAALAAQAVDEGLAYKALQKLIEVSNG